MKILIADDHSIVRRGLITILMDELPHALISEAKDGAELLQMASGDSWDIIISDISMPGRSGMEILKELKEAAPKIPVLILSIHPPEQYAVRTIKAGASGYLTKESAPEELVKIVRHIISGRKYITPEIAEMLAESYNDNDKPPHENLSDREFEVMKLISSGKTVSEIADVLSLSVNTISTYRSRILEKMRMGTNAELTHYTISNKLI
jgi:two-component system invasion response regulator UvrY